MKPYTLGFVFTPDFQQVLLVHKKRPDWQIGRLNGPGGKLEPGETPLACVAREVNEETGLAISAADWTSIGSLAAHGWQVHLFTAVWTGQLEDAQQLTDEAIEWVSAVSLPVTVIDNLRWLIPLAINKLQAVDELALAAVSYRQ